MQDLPTTTSARNNLRFSKGKGIVDNALMDDRSNLSGARLRGGKILGSVRSMIMRLVASFTKTEKQTRVLARNSPRFLHQTRTVQRGKTVSTPIKQAREKTMLSQEPVDTGILHEYAESRKLHTYLGVDGDGVPRHLPECFE